MKEQGIGFYSYKDIVIFEKNEIQKDDNSPYTVFTPYSRKWKEKFNDKDLKNYPSEDLQFNFLKCKFNNIPTLQEIGFTEALTEEIPTELSEGMALNYDKTRDYPALEGTTRLGVHLRFGTISIRKLVKDTIKLNEILLNELLWREFYQMILYNFPKVVNQSFKEKYDSMKWRNNVTEFRLWCEGKTGYPIVDAGMRQLNETGYMHNRVRMITASFLVKHLLIDWRWGEAYFAEKLLDFELASNNGGWQWAAGTGCDAVPYFRIFNPALQTAKFDPEHKYISKWIPNYNELTYIKPIVEHKLARERCLKVYKACLL